MLSPRKAHRHKRSTAISGDFDLSEFAGGDLSHSHYRSPSNSNNQFNIGSPLRSGQALDLNPKFTFSNKTEGTPLYSPSKGSQTPITPHENYTSTFDEPSFRSPRSNKSPRQRFFLSDDTKIENDIPAALIDLDDIGKNKRNVTLSLDQDTSSKLHKRTESAPEFFNFSPTKFHSHLIIEEEDDNSNSNMNSISSFHKAADVTENKTVANKHINNGPSLQLLELQPAINVNRIPSTTPLKSPDLNGESKQKEKSPSSSIFQMDIEHSLNSHSSLSTGQKSVSSRRKSMSPVKPMTLNYADIRLSVGEPGPKVLKEREKGKENVISPKKSETSKNHRRSKSFNFSFLSSSVEDEKTSKGRGRFLHWMRRKRD
ncbi:Hypothetical protein PP7435_CHR4-0518 [Komagataella phaffii CBS 7435]|uniref:Uncharacterized protein n=2 Tax=Komagataella phaffii TaxID=460519 RepID=C4R7Z0_KOMPG|nr:Hypothetical protein PAS_chr4_0462 [Komagataella phaffii GS115]AOA64663.1 GQ67_04821T0 [Komagataella phaffii]CAH2450897.1 Hypothetical protein BQ9382_C4-2705 [Komagataella phaffii CBS 7435]AOA70207.1 GQ68_04793T0 [Komagataella phaffii GS115]CAY71715.1 Hypothetical protein PAS_chr4_0462 [Komagataella phaffii GS115]CCA40682.1 Hypothetical protein PP7435_CHR4-0518 [Komagataella phaffii CBS 7435]